MWVAWKESSKVGQMAAPMVLSLVALLAAMLERCLVVKWVALDAHSGDLMDDSASQKAEQMDE